MSNCRRDECCQVGQRFDGNTDDFISGGHLQIEFRLDRLTQQTQVTVVYMPSVFPEVTDDPLGPREEVECVTPLKEDYDELVTELVAACKALGQKDCGE